MYNTKYNIFVASSMSDETIRHYREIIDETINEVNLELSNNGNKFSYEATIIGETRGASGEENTQEDINQMIYKCDLFIILARNNHIIRHRTINEYDTASNKSKSAANRKPLIKAYLIKENDTGTVSVPYERQDQVTKKIIRYENFIELLEQDSLRYTDIIADGKFKNHFKKFLMTTFIDGLRKFKQNEISYENHLCGTTQEYRGYSHKYFRREQIDGKLERISSKSSLIILEGNTYSGKTRAAYELMKQEKWTNANFYIYRCNHDAFIKDLDCISFNPKDSIHDKVIFIDDINEAINKNTEVDGRKTLWSELRSIKSNTLPHWPKTQIIITIAGKLSDKEKQVLYTKIFGDNYYSLKDRLKEITVNFDIYDREHFKKMVNDMVKEGIITKNQTRPGNYTIGSLFIDNEKIKNTIEGIIKEYGDPMKRTLEAIKLNWMYAEGYKGNIIELKRIYKCLTKTEVLSTDHPIDSNIDILRSKGLLFVNGDKVMLDSFVIESINIILHDNRSAINTLVEFAKNIIQQSPDYSSYHNLSCLEEMGYRICRNTILDDEEIRYLVQSIYNHKHIPDSLDITESDVLKNMVKMMTAICHHNMDSIYSIRFCCKAVQKLSDFNDVYKIIDYLKRASKKNNPAKKTAEEIYKEISYSLISGERQLTLIEESKILKDIFDDKGNMKEPFRYDDLRKVHILKKMTQVLSKTPIEIIELAEKISADRNFESDNEQNPKSIYDSLFDDEEEDIEVNNMSYGILAPLGYIAVSALKKTENYEELCSVLNRLEATESTYLKNSLNGDFAHSFYFAIKYIAMKYSYEDRNKLFKFIYSLNVNPARIFKSIDNISSVKTVEKISASRIHAMNVILPLLDENDALDAYISMKNNNQIDSFTLSLLLNNESLGFEHLHHLASGDEGKFLIYNQLLSKAETVDDATACLKLMGTRNSDPRNLKDEFALGHYMSIKGIDADTCIDITKGWKKKQHNKTLNEITLGVLSGKLHFNSLKEIFENEIGEITTKYGLNEDEIKQIRKNHVCNNHLFLKAQAQEKYKDYIKNKFECMLNDPDLQSLVIGSHNNEDKSILSSYLSNKHIFRTYDEQKNWGDAFCEKHKDTLRKTPFIYRVYLWKVKGIAENNGREWARTEINKLLIEAYNYFAQYYPKVVVTEHMSRLYNYIIGITKEEDINEKLAYAFEDKILECTFIEYLKQILDTNPAYANEEFIRYALQVMETTVNHVIFDLIGQIARKNKIGIKFDYLYSTDRNIKVPKVIADELLKVNDGEIVVNTDIIKDFSYIKVLWWLIKNKRITYIEAKKHLERNPNIKVTQTYMNIAFQYMHAAYNRGTGAFTEMKELLEKYFNDESSVLYKSIRMFTAMLLAANSEEEISYIYRVFPEEYRNTPEHLGALIQKRANLCKKTVCHKPDIKKLFDTLKNDILSNRDIITITHINYYLKAMVMILRKEITADTTVVDAIKSRMNECWIDVYRNNHINIGRLFDLQEEDWIFEANVQTYSYFPITDPLIPVYIAERFGGNYFYETNKDCLADCITNYDIFWTNEYIDKNAVNAFAEVLKNNKYRNSRKTICCRSLLYEKDKISAFILSLTESCEKLILETYDYIRVGEFNTDKLNSLLKNTERIEQLKHLFTKHKELIKNCPKNIRNDNKRLYDLIFYQNIQ